MTQSIEIYDTTLRDGAQGEGVNFSVSDKCRIAEHLDAFGGLIRGPRRSRTVVGAESHARSAARERHL